MNKVICPNCNTENEGVYQFCMHCGTALNAPIKIKMVWCPSCGSQNPEGFTYCKKCGASLQEKHNLSNSIEKNISKSMPTKPMRNMSVFLCHSSSDKKVVRKLYRQLGRENWIDPWFDEEKLLPGENWDLEIRKAVKLADIVIVCLSKGSVNKEGYLQKEIKHALDIADEKPEGTIFVIPLKLDACEVPDRLSTWQWVNYFEDSAYDKLMRALRKRAVTLGIMPEKA